MNWAHAFPEQLRDAPAVRALGRTLQNGRLAHGILLYGQDMEGVAAVGRALAGSLLGVPEGSSAESHPDCFALRPAKKMRVIGVDPVRELIGDLSRTANAGERKVALIHEADRMNKESANVFLKTLEEPSPGTTLLLLTSRPYALLPTIRSRCLHFRIPGEFGSQKSEIWLSWLNDYKGWIVSVAASPTRAPEVSQAVMTIYGLVSRYRSVREQRVAEELREGKEDAPVFADDDEKTAWEVGVGKGVRRRLWTEIEVATHDAAYDSFGGENASEMANRLYRVTRTLERMAGLLEVNFDEDTALEHVLLESLRIWAGR